MASSIASSDLSMRRYSTVAIVLHWLIAALLLFEVGLGLRMMDARGPVRFASFQLHKSVGITILLLVVLRLVWRWYRTPPPLAHGGWQRALAHAVHLLFYLLLFALPLSGWLIVSSSRIIVPTLLYGAIPWPHLPALAALSAPARDAWHTAGLFIHHNGINLIYALFALHIAGVIKHQFIDRDADLARMAPGVARGAWRDPRVVAIAAGAVVAAGLGLRWLPIGVPVRAMPPAAQISTRPAIPAATRPEPAVARPVPPVAQVADSKPPVAGEAIAAAAPAVWKIAQGSTLNFTTRWSGDAVNGNFGQFDGDITFDPDHLDSARVEIRIPVASITTGDDQRDETLKSEDWFSTAVFGSAVFKADRFRRVGTGRYVASARLTIKGTTLPIALPFTLTITGDRAVMRGTATVDRTAYKIGEGEYAATDDIPAAVKVDVVVNATRAK